MGMGVGMGWRRRRKMGLLGSGFVGMEVLSRVWWDLWGGWGSWSCSLYVFVLALYPRFVPQNEQTNAWEAVELRRARSCMFLHPLKDFICSYCI